MNLAEVDAVTVDAYGTLLGLADPVPALVQALVRHGVDRDAEIVRAAFGVEAAHYKEHAHRARDAEALAALREECAGVFLNAAGAGVPAAQFVQDFVSALVFDPEPGAKETIRGLAARGLTLAVVANWDVSLRTHLETHELTPYFSAIVIAAEVGVKKPAPEPFLIALDRLGVEPARALHVGDDGVDQQGAAAAGLRFARVPLARLLA